MNEVLEAHRKTVQKMDGTPDGLHVAIPHGDLVEMGFKEIPGTKKDRPVKLTFREYKELVKQPATQTKAVQK